MAYSIHLKETYENVKTVLEKIKYVEYNWYMCGEFNMIGFLVGLQGGYTKFSCYLCLWYSWADSEQCTRKEWPARTDVPGQYNIVQKFLQIWYLLIVIEHRIQ